jgi:hypothetical protein
MSYETPDYSKGSEPDGVGVEFYAPALNLVVLITYVVATAAIPALAPPHDNQPPEPPTTQPAPPDTTL